ncbi:MAG: hypothetical protein ABSE47_08920 [Acidimicrobiales bacterium]
MDTTELDAAYRELLEAAADAGPAARFRDAWDVDTVLAHVVAGSRMLAAACAELLSGRIPVVDNRPTQSRLYLDAIVTSVADRDELLDTVRRSGQEVVILASQLEEAQTAICVPTIILDGGRIKVQRPLPFSELLQPGHVREHLAQLQAMQG